MRCSTRHPAYLPGEVLIDDRLFVDGTTIPSEDPLVDDVAEALEAEDSASALRDLGVRWVVVESGMQSGPVPSGTTVHDGEDLTLVDLGADVGPGAVGVRVHVIADPLGHILATGLLLGSLFLRGFRAAGGRRRMTPPADGLWEGTPA